MAVVVGCVLLLLFVVSGYAWWLRRKLRGLEDKSESWRAVSRQLEERLARVTEQLDKYGPIAEAEARAIQLRKEAETHSARIRLETERECSSVRLAAAQYRREADDTLAEADEQARALLASTRRHAEQIAGEALRAKADAGRVEARLQALRNAVEGYGNQYLVPLPGMLDELAEDAGFCEPGRRLKAARDEARSMIRSGLAAACDEPNAELRERASRLALDAFNGRVECILFEARQHNVGILQQKLRDAAELVNESAQSFGNARILPKYVEQRLTELNWLVALHAQGEREQREQRALHERICSEERAVDDLTRARQVAHEDEGALRAALAKLQRKRNWAPADQRAKYDEELLQLDAALLVVQSNAKRAEALSTSSKAGVVYVLSNVGSFGEGVFKIGTTRRFEPQDCIDELSGASVPFPFDLHALIRSEDAPALQHELRRRLHTKALNKVDATRGFFRCSVRDIRATLDDLGLTKVEWTLSAPKREFRESLALEEHALEASWEAEQEHSLDTGVRRRTIAYTERAS
jgi:hypothetical protein